MREEDFYRSALARAAEQAINAHQALAEYSDRLMYLKSDQVADKWLKQTMYIDRLNDEAMCVAVCHHFYKHWWNGDHFTQNAAGIHVAFIRDLQPMLDSKRMKLTETERKLLKELQDMRKRVPIRDRQNVWKFQDGEHHYHRIERIKSILNNLEECKGKIKAGIVLNWEFGFAELLDEDFLDDDLSLDNDRGY